MESTHGDPDFPNMPDHVHRMVANYIKSDKDFNELAPVVQRMIKKALKDGRPIDSEEDQSFPEKIEEGQVCQTAIDEEEEESDITIMQIPSDVKSQKCPQEEDETPAVQVAIDMDDNSYMNRWFRNGTRAQRINEILQDCALMCVLMIPTALVMIFTIIMVIIYM